MILKGLQTGEVETTETAKVKGLSSWWMSRYGRPAPSSGEESKLIKAVLRHAPQFDHEAWLIVWVLKVDTVC